MPESNEPPHKRRKLSATEIEKVIMGKELSDVQVNLAQRLLRAEFPWSPLHIVTRKRDDCY